MSRDDMSLTTKDKIWVYASFAIAATVYALVVVSIFKWLWESFK